MVAGVDIAVELHHPGVAACARHGAYAGLHAGPVGKRGVEQLDEVLSHIVFHPFVEDGTQKLAPLRGRYREVGQRGIVCIHRRGQCAPVGVGYDALYNGGELYESTFDFLEEVVEVERIVGVEVVDHGEGVPFYAMFFQQVDAAHHLVERWRADVVAAVLVVKLLWAVDRYAHKPVVVLEKSAPFVGEQCAVGLDGIVDYQSAAIFFLQLDNLFVE